MRAAKRQSEIARLKKEVDELRNAARQLMAGLTEYSKQSNWATSQGVGDRDGELLWKGEGEGPHVARKFLGLEEEKN